jgi:hypothetical protein
MLLLLLVTQWHTKLLLLLQVAYLMMPDGQQQFDQLHVPAKVRQMSGQLATHLPAAAAAAGLASYTLLLQLDCQQTSAAPRQGRVPADCLRQTWLQLKACCYRCCCCWV